MKALLPLIFLFFISSPGWATDRHYYIGIEESIWNYAPSGKNMLNGKPFSEDLEFLQGSQARKSFVYKKALYFQYTDNTFQRIIEKPSWLGFLGPMIKAETGDFIYVHVKNNASRAYSYHPHGLTYSKENEGAIYPDNTTGQEKEDGYLEPGKQYTYKWYVEEHQGPGPNDSNCVTRIYHSHIDTARDVASGLIGPILTCKRGTLNGDTEKDIDRSYFLLFSTTDESRSWYSDENIRAFTESGKINTSDPGFEESMSMQSINGYIYGNLPNLTMCAEDRVKWYFVGMGGEADIHPVYLHGQTLISRNHRKDTIVVFPSSLEDAFMVAKGTGVWMLGCQRVCRHFSNKSQLFFERSPTRIGGTYKKLVYREYIDASFQTQKAREGHLGILGPVIKAEVGQTIKITFYNNASLPLSIQPHGLLYNKSKEGSFYKTPGESTPPPSSHVNPGTIFVYTWEVPKDVGPTSTDPTCLTWFYYSSVNEKRNINSGLLGPLLVCRNGSLGEDGKQKGVDKEFYLLATIFDENESDLLEENIRTFITEPENIDKEDPDFQASNKMYSINGYMYGNLPGLDMCLGDNVLWHVFSVGSVEDLHGIYFSGNTFTSLGARKDTIPVFPHTSQTLLMTPDSIGTFDLVCITIKHNLGGMKHKYHVRQCGKPNPDQTQYQEEKIIYIAAEEMEWDYSPSRKWENELHRLQRENQTSMFVDKSGTLLGSKYKKVLYRQYDDDTFTNQTKRNEDEKHLDILGPLILLNPGQRIQIIFKNKASRPYSIHAHGVKTNNSTVVPTQPGEIQIYNWQIPDRTGPTSLDFECIPWFYYSTVSVAKDLYSGLVGPLIVCRKDISPNIVHRVLHFMVFDENESWYFEDNINTYASEPNKVDKEDDNFQLSNHMHAINGRLFGNNQGLTFHVGDVVNWYLIGMGDEADMHTVHFHGHSYEYKDWGVYRSDVYDLPPGVYRTVKMYPRDAGTWLFHCHVFEHIGAGMESTYTVLERKGLMERSL
nr:ceruloplasmin isoform X3 [Macaca fascicularis]